MSRHSFLTIQMTRQKTLAATCSCGEWSEETEAEPPMFKGYGLVNHWVKHANMLTRVGAVSDQSQPAGEKVSEQIETPRQEVRRLGWILRHLQRLSFEALHDYLMNLHGLEGVVGK